MFLFRSNGQYLGFITGDNIFDRDGRFIGWKSVETVWGANGQYRGQLSRIGSTQNFYVVKYIFAVAPIPQIPRVVDINKSLPVPPANILPVHLQAGFVDGF
jgi:hypothetical protein